MMKQQDLTEAIITMVVMEAILDMVALLVMVDMA
jgi:hypothetical protein